MNRSTSKLPKLRPLRSAPVRAMWRLNTELGHLGESRDADWLIYNPIQMYAYHRLALAAATAAVDGLEAVAPDARSYADVGAGSGAIAAEVARRGRHVQACERSRVGRLHARRQQVSCAGFDLGGNPPARLDGPFDLAYCFEVAEHLPPELGTRLVDFLCETAPLVVFSAAQPGQGGLAHINEQPPEYWCELFGSGGYEHLPELTSRFRQGARAGGPCELWLEANTLVFRKRA